MTRRTQNLLLVLAAVILAIGVVSQLFLFGK